MFGDASAEGGLDTHQVIRALLFFLSLRFRDLRKNEGNGPVNIELVELVDTVRLDTEFEEGVKFSFTIL